MEKVKCSHCGLEFNKEDTVPCTWKDIEPGKDFTWYYCKTCNKCFENDVNKNNLIGGNMKNIDYVLENFIHDDALTREDVIVGMCPKIFDNSLEELDCDNYECSECWDLEVR